MTGAQDIAVVLRKRLGHHAKRPTGRVGVALSGGVDSCSVLAALIRAGQRPIVVSYTPDTHYSTDFKMARQTAANLGLPFVPVYVSMRAADLELTVREVIRHGWKTKLEAECLSPMLHVVRAAAGAGVETLFTGDQSDGYFINNNWMARNYDRAQGIPGYLRTPVKDDLDASRIDALRDIYYDQDRSCSGQVIGMCNEFGMEGVVPYRDPRIRSAFQGTHWKDVNLPRVKEPIRLAYAADFRKDYIWVRDQVVNLHRGDSLFAVTMGKTLMEQPHLKGPWRSVTGLYAAIARGEV